MLQSDRTRAPINEAGQSDQAEGGGIGELVDFAADLAPKFYPILSSPWLLDLPGWAVVATGAGAEPSA